MSNEQIETSSKNQEAPLQCGRCHIDVNPLSHTEYLKVKYHNACYNEFAREMEEQQKTK